MKKSEGEMKLLATRLHNNFCNFNHIDHCSWYHEKKDNGEEDWDAICHVLWLNKAEKVLSLLPDRSFDEILEVIDAVAVTIA